MFTTRELQDEIIRLKKEKDVCILAHAYQSHDIWEVADYVGDSYGLSKQAAHATNKTVLMCGVRFMAETCKILSPEKKVILSNAQAGCPTHVRMSVRDVEKARKAHPDALLLVHPECLPEVSEKADFRGSTTGIMDYARKSDAKEFIIGTENSIVQHLQYECPDKKFYPLSKDCVCHNMKLTTLGDVYHCLLGDGGEEIALDEKVMKEAGRCINTMLTLGQ